MSNSPLPNRIKTTSTEFWNHKKSKRSRRLLLHFYFIQKNPILFFYHLIDGSQFLEQIDQHL
jgi:hypothetical protein